MENIESKIPPLNEVLKFSCPPVIESFCNSFNIPESEAEELFKNMLKWLWFSQTNSLKKTMISTELAIIDEMWHTFILCTSEYFQFCKKYFDKYIHHKPTSNEEKYTTDPLKRMEYLDLKKLQAREIYDVLGKEVLIEWFYMYPEKYSKVNIHKLRVDPSESVKKITSKAS